MKPLVNMAGHWLILLPQFWYCAEWPSQHHSSWWNQLNPLLQLYLSSTFFSAQSCSSHSLMVVFL